MERDEAIELLKGGPDGITKWNQWWDQNRRIPDLSDANLTRANLYGAILIGAKLNGARFSDANLSLVNLTRANLEGADFINANLESTYLGQANLNSARLRGANLRGANLSGTYLIHADLRDACLISADLRDAYLINTFLTGADLSQAICLGTSFGGVDLSEVKGLESIKHVGPSTLGVDTLFRSRGKLPDVFLRGCGVSDKLIEQLPAIIKGMEPIQFYSCFISYSTKNQDFAERLNSKLRDKGLMVWFAPEDIEGGKKLHEQIDEAIRVYDKLLLVLSAESMNSEWVKNEIRKARKAELKEGRRKLFPIRLVDFETIQAWECFDADSGKDLAVEIREYFIPDFSNWKDHDSFEAAFARLLENLKTDYIVLPSGGVPLAGSAPPQVTRAQGDPDREGGA